MTAFSPRIEFVISATNMRSGVGRLKMTTQNLLLLFAVSYAYAEKSVDDRLALQHRFTIWVRLGKFWSNLEAVTFLKRLCHGPNLINLEY